MSAPQGTCRFELLTARGVGGIAVIAVRGRDRERALRTILSSPLGALATTPALVSVVIDGAVVDRALLVDRPERATTELHVHGSPAVLEAIETAVGGFAEPVTTPAESLLERAVTQAQLGLAVEQLGMPPWSEFVARLRGLDARERDREFDALRTRTAVARALTTVCRGVLVGRQNAGKSTLLNRLVFRDRALAGPRAGLTRDPVREATELDGYPFLLIDTAGEGETSDPSDVVALERGRRERAGGLIVLVADGSVPFGPIEQGLVGSASLVIRTKLDLRPDPDWPELPCRVVSVGALDPRNASGIRREVGRALREVRGLPPAPHAGVGGPIAWSDADLVDAAR